MLSATAPASLTVRLVPPPATRLVMGPAARLPTGPRTALTVLAFLSALIL